MPAFVTPSTRIGLLRNDIRRISCDCTHATDFRLPFPRSLQTLSECLKRASLLAKQHTSPAVVNAEVACRPAWTSWMSSQGSERPLLEPLCYWYRKCEKDPKSLELAKAGNDVVRLDPRVDVESFTSEVAFPAVAQRPSIVSIVAYSSSSWTSQPLARDNIPSIAHLVFFLSVVIRLLYLVSMSLVYSFRCPFLCWFLMVTVPSHWVIRCHWVMHLRVVAVLVPDS